jgi:predicted amidophosphoribosyltransferase
VHNGITLLHAAMVIVMMMMTKHQLQPGRLHAVLLHFAGPGAADVERCVKCIKPSKSDAGACQQCVEKFSGKQLDKCLRCVKRSEPADMWKCYTST